LPAIRPCYTHHRKTRERVPVPAGAVQFRSYRADMLDVCRGLLALWVLLTHLAIWSAYRGDPIPVLDQVNSWLLRISTPHLETHPAVLAFVVLSGYCIHRNGPAGTAHDLKQFAIRRLFRIYPVFLLALLAGYLTFRIGTRVAPELAQAMMVATQVTPTCLALRATSLLSVSADAANVCGHLGNAPLATVMVEVALYAAYPLILFAPLSDRARAALIGVPFGIGFVLTVATPGMEWWWHNSSLVNFLPFWWIGAWFADLRRPKPTRGILLAIAACWAACTVILLLAPNLPAAELRKIATAILFAAAFAALDTPAITSPRLAAMGRTGYSLYAFHMPVMVLAFAFGLSWWVSLGACLLSGILGYLAIERPAIALGQLVRRLSQKSPIPG
jgi:peptidoglycan/LPS O-acetylase OafA/YrhL